MTIFAVQKVDHLTILMEIDMIIKRDYYLNQLISSKHNGLIKIVTGLRRSGKSYLLFKVGSINSIFYFLHKTAEPFNCLEQDNLA